MIGIGGGLVYRYALICNDVDSVEGDGSKCDMYEDWESRVAHGSAMGARVQAGVFEGSEGTGASTTVSIGGREV